MKFVGRMLVGVVIMLVLMFVGVIGFLVVVFVYWNNYSKM